MSSVPQLTSLFARLWYALSTPTGTAQAQSGGPWRPPQWSTGKVPFTLTATDSVGNTTVYVFDGVRRIEHEGRSIATKNPIQSGAAITDHIYNEPRRIVVEIQMSDAMASFVVGQFADSSSRSVSAYQTLRGLRDQRQILSISTRLDSYDRVFISSINVSDEQKTANGLIARITFDELLFAQIEAVSSVIQSPLFPQVTESTVAGQAQSSPVPAAIQSQYNVSNATGDLTTAGAVPAAGDWSSMSVGGLPVS